MSLDGKLPPKAPGERFLSYEIYQSYYLLLGSMHEFFGWGGENEISATSILLSENFPWRGKFLGGELLRRSFTLVEFARIPLRNLFICLSFSLSIQF